MTPYQAEVEAPGNDEKHSLPAPIPPERGHDMAPALASLDELRKPRWYDSRRHQDATPEPVAGTADADSISDRIDRLCDLGLLMRFPGNDGRMADKLFIRVWGFQFFSDIIFLLLERGR